MDKIMTNVRVLDNTTIYDANGTSLVGYVATTYDALIDTFGEPTCDGDGGYKVRAEWILATPAGVATIYDWKEDQLLCDVTDWHVGGANVDVVDYVNYALNGDIDVVRNYVGTHRD